ncbi:hypothetical protein P9112_004758 [Eukaryota sp. TZLM1-RC]
MQQQPPQDNPILSFVNSIPPISRILFVSLIATFLALVTNVVSDFDLFFDPQHAFMKMQLWRCITTFTYMGTDIISVFFSLVTLYRTAVDLEQQSFQGRPEDMLFMVLMGMTLFLIAGWILTLPFLFNCLFFYLLYIWARRNPYARVNFLFIPMPAPYLPYVMVLVNFAMGNKILPIIIGLVVGHIYWYFADVLPLQTGRQYLHTPNVIKALFQHQERPRVGRQRWGRGHRLGEE